jgi:site-specific DNA-adenine methylase
VQPNGQILIGGGFSYLDLNSYNGIVRLNTDGTLDLSFTSGHRHVESVTGFSDTIYANITPAQREYPHRR